MTENAPLRAADEERNAVLKDASALSDGNDASLEEGDNIITLFKRGVITVRQRRSVLQHRIALFVGSTQGGVLRHGGFLLQTGSIHRVVYATRRPPRRRRADRALPNSSSVVEYANQSDSAARSGNCSCKRYSCAQTSAGCCFPRKQQPAAK